MEKKTLVDPKEMMAEEKEIRDKKIHNKIVKVVKQIEQRADSSRAKRVRDYFKQRTGESPS